MTSPLYELTHAAHWHNDYERARQDLNPAAYTFLLNCESMTAHLKKICHPYFTLKVLHQSWQPPHEHERMGLKLCSTDDTFIREVSLGKNNDVYMWGRTIIPKSTLTGKEHELLELGNKSLGEVLFQYPQLARGQFEIAQMSFQNTKTWARRSVFCIENKSLLVTEILLPILMEQIIRIEGH